MVVILALFLLACCAAVFSYLLLVIDAATPSGVPEWAEGLLEWAPVILTVSRTAMVMVAVIGLLTLIGTLIG